jgi:hypothetical protein
MQYQATHTHTHTRLPPPAGYSCTGPSIPRTGPSSFIIHTWINLSFWDWKQQSGSWQPNKIRSVGPHWMNQESFFSSYDFTEPPAKSPVTTIDFTAYAEILKPLRQGRIQICASCWMRETPMDFTMGTSYGVVRKTVPRHLFFLTIVAPWQLLHKLYIYIYIYIHKNKCWKFQFSFFWKRKTNYFERKIKNLFKNILNYPGFWNEIFNINYFIIWQTHVPKASSRYNYYAHHTKWQWLLNYNLLSSHARSSC